MTQVASMPQLDFNHALAVELWDAIFDFIPEDPRSSRVSRTLYSLALTSRLFCQLARPRLFRSVVVSGAPDAVGFELFLQLLTISPCVGSCIRSLALQWDKPSQPLHTMRHLRHLDVGLLSQILVKLPNLRHLSFADFNFSNLNILSNPSGSEMKPIQTLDLESLSIAGACAVPGKASDYLHVLSLFGTIGKLVITELPEVTCTCALKDAIAAQAVRRASRSTPEYFERMFRHHPPRSRLAVGELDLRELRYWPMPLLFVLKTLQHTSTVRSLTSLAVSFRGTRESVACGELLRLCGAGLRHCKIEMVHGMFQPHALESDVLSLSSCTSLETLCLTTEQTPPSKSPGLTVSPMFVDILAHVPTANLEHLVLALRPCSGSREETGDQWSKLRDFLRRCVSLQTLAFVVESEDRNVKDVVCMEMAEWHERRIVIFNTGS